MVLKGSKPWALVGKEASSGLCLKVRISCHREDVWEGIASSGVRRRIVSAPKRKGSRGLVGTSGEIATAGQDRPRSKRMVVR